MKYSEVLPFVMLAFSLATVASSCRFVSAGPESWSEVVRFTGAGEGQPRTTPDFTIEYADWRIIWNYTYESASTAGFVVSTYTQGPSGDLVSFIFCIGGSPAGGIGYVNNKTGTFYMEIAAGEAVTSYTIIIEQDLDSIPESPSPLMALSLAMAASLLAVTINRKRNHSEGLGNNFTPNQTNDVPCSHGRVAIERQYTRFRT